MTVPLTYWYDRVSIQCPGLDEGLYGVALHKVMRDYFRDSRAWYEDLSIAATQGTDLINLDDQYSAPTETYKRVAQIQRVWTGDRLVPALTQPWFSLRYRENLGFYWYADQPPVLRFSQPLSEDSTILVGVTIKPLDGANEVPDFVEQHHDDPIESGLLAYFLAMPAKPWTNLPVAAFHERKYREQVAEMRAVAERAYTPADVQWAYPRSFV